MGRRVGKESMGLEVEGDWSSDEEERGRAEGGCRTGEEEDGMRETKDLERPLSERI